MSEASDRYVAAALALAGQCCDAATLERVQREFARFETIAALLLEHDFDLHDEPLPRYLP